jgi:hypothetical protein
VYRPADADVAGPAESTAAAMAELEEQLAHSLLLLAEGSSCAGPLYPVSLLGLAGGAAGALAAAAGGGIVVRGAPIPCIPFRVSWRSSWRTRCCCWRRDRRARGPYTLYPF